MQIRTNNYKVISQILFTFSLVQDIDNSLVLPGSIFCGTGPVFYLENMHIYADS